MPMGQVTAKIRVDEFENGVYFYTVSENGNNARTGRFVVAK